MCTTLSTTRKIPILTMIYHLRWSSSMFKSVYPVNCDTFAKINISSLKLKTNIKCFFLKILVGRVILNRLITIWWDSWSCFVKIDAEKTRANIFDVEFFWKKVWLTLWKRCCICPSRMTHNGQNQSSTDQKRHFIF